MKTSRYIFRRFWFAGAFTDRAFYLNRIKESGIIDIVKDRIIDFVEEKVESEEKRLTFFKKRLVPKDVHYDWYLIVNMDGLDEHQEHIINAYMLGWCAGIFSAHKIL